MPTSPTTSTDARRRPVFVAIGLGANVGDRESFLRKGIGALAEHVEGLRVSPFYETSPLGGPARQPDFLNAVVTGRTSLSAAALLALLRQSEIAAGRRRKRRAQNGPRTLDLDLLLYGSACVATRTLTVPHPRMASRLFVLVPLAGLAPRRVVPGTGKTVARLLAEARRVSDERVRPWRAPRRPSPRGGRARTR